MIKLRKGTLPDYSDVCLIIRYDCPAGSFGHVMAGRKVKKIGGVRPAARRMLNDIKLAISDRA